MSVCCDLRLPHEPASTVKARLLKAFELGQSVVAVDVGVEQKQLRLNAAKKSAAKKAKLDNSLLEDFPKPPEVKLTSEEVRTLTAKLGREPQVLTRLTLKFEDNGFLPFFNRSENVSKYDLLAICPPSAATLQALLKTGFQAEVIAFEAEKAFDVRWTRKLYRECLAAGAHFELPYAPMIRDGALRRKIIGLAHNFSIAGKCRGIVLTSQAETVLELRQPLDVAALSYVLGMSEEQGLNGVFKHPLAVLAAAEGRKMGPYRVRVERIADLKDKSKVPQLPQGELPNEDYEEEEDDEDDDDDDVENDQPVPKKESEDFLAF